jgi:predicted NBD/HSP70 family sugar kinase
MRGGIDLGGTKIEAVVVEGENRIVGKARRITPSTGGPEAVAEEMTEAMSEAAAAAGVEASQLRGVGVGSPGTVDAKAGTVAEAANLPSWEESFPLAATLAEALGTRVKLGNDVGVAVEAEAALGAGRPFRSFLGVWWGTGVGGAVILGGKRWLGRGAAGELGHIVVKLGGARCRCGRRGCLEAYAGRAALERRVQRAQRRGQKTKLYRIMEKKGHTRLTSGVWQAALEQHDRVAEALIERAIEALGAGAASVINLLDLEAVIVGGGLGTRLGDEAVERIRSAMQPNLFRPHTPPEVRGAELGDPGGAIGAARLIRLPRLRAT